jgi:acyl-CoA synthetase (AMP-forming)/AMP-acid ligase II
MRWSYTRGVSSKPLIGETIGDFLDTIAAEFAGNDALVSVFEDRRLTYAQFLDEVNCCARALMALGVEKGDRVGIWSTNCAKWVIVQFATAKIGAVLVNINPAYRLHELEFALRQSECQWLIIGEGFKDADYAAMAQRGRGDDRRGAASLLHGRIMDEKIPHYVKFVTAFPTTVTGKIQKFRMREASARDFEPHTVP